MLTVISPAKRLDWTARDVQTTMPAFQDDAVTLARAAKQLSQKDLRKLMDISADLAKLNADRFKVFEDAPEGERPAALAFAGDTYMGLEAASLDADTMDYAQDHLRILSGLYGLLRPLDAIRPYRLEMGSRLKTRKGPSLYAYWGPRLAEALSEHARAIGTDTLVNCASVEYFSAVDERALTLDIVTPQFFEDKPGGPKIVSFFAKKARGAMARFILERRLTTPDQILDFDIGGYTHVPDLSAPGKPAFLRAEAASAAA
ncbi:peroxide stress protein YaaA [Hasllibacter sp. MH4015]|uniref:peroxide stress protein YaaA n=1 Tax=Hasllibacter sp. MH4015 TaxID=2854029 RepID=UPI001CD208B9|nr:peroxide stress protein YaaA [Hasllibacter sp. MH4015]